MCASTGVQTNTRAAFFRIMRANKCTNPNMRYSKNHIKHRTLFFYISRTKISREYVSPPFCSFDFYSYSSPFRPQKSRACGCVCDICEGPQLEQLCAPLSHHIGPGGCQCGGTSQGAWVGLSMGGDMWGSRVVLRGEVASGEMLWQSNDECTVSFIKGARKVFTSLLSLRQ